MKKRNNIIQLIDILGILGYLLIAVSCFLPFLDYTTIAGTEIITYFQGNGKLVLAFSVLAILVIIIKKFKYTFMCLGLSIGVLLYDIIFGLLAVVREKTTSYNLKYGFYFIIFGIIINLIYIILKKRNIDKQYSEQNGIDNELSIDDVEIIQDDIEHLEATNNDYVNPQMQLLDGYKFSEEDNELETQVETILDVVVEEEKATEKENIEVQSVSIFDAAPSTDITDVETNNNIKTINNNKPLYKLCTNCGMQINYDDEQCPVCGKHF